MPLLFVVVGVLVLFILMIKFKFNGFFALVITAILVGIMEGMPLTKVISSLESGFGSTLGGLVMVLGFGAILGKMMADSGAAQRIANTLLHKFGVKGAQWAIMITGLICGIAMFYEIGFVVLIPLAFSVAVAADIPLLWVGIPMASSLCVCHGLLPPHPSPTALVNIYKADTGTTLLLGLIVAIPTAIVSGPLLAQVLKKMGLMRMEISIKLFSPKIFTEEEMPSFGISILTGVMPVILMALSTASSILLPVHSGMRAFFNFIGEDSVAMLFSALFALFSCGLLRKKSMPTLMKTSGEEISSIALILLIIGAGGGFKQVLISSGVGTYIAHMLAHVNISPLILAWTIAAILRVTLGSATVAGLTAGGIVAPMITGTSVNPALLVLATGSGSLFLSHVNDPAFWIFKEYFNLSIPDTMKSWTICVTVLSLMGLAGTMLLSLAV